MSGQAQPAPHTGRNNSAQLLGGTITVTSIAFVTLGLRLFCKGRYAKAFGVDDALLILSFACLISFTILECCATKYGLGTPIAEYPDFSILPHMNKLLFVGEFFGIISIIFAKTSFCVTLLRLATTKWARFLIWACLITVNLVMWPCALEFFVSCQPLEKQWDSTIEGTCWPGDVNINIAVFAGVWSGVTDFALAILPWAMFRKVQMRPVEKLGVCLCMSMGVFSGIVACIKAAQLVGSLDDYTFKSTPLLIWSATESAVVITACSIPFMRLFMKEIYMKTTHSRSKSRFKGSGYNLDENKGNNSFQLSSSQSFHNRTRVHAEPVSKTADDASDSSLFGETRNKHSIMRTHEITIEHGRHRDGSMV